MKNGVFKHGAKRGNFHNPAKDVAEFWVKQSDYELQELLKSDSFRSSCDSRGSAVIIHGPASTFHDSQTVQILLERWIVTAATQLDFLNAVVFHGVHINRTDYVLISPSVYQVLRIVRQGSSHFLTLEEVSSAVEVDEHGRYFIHVSHGPHELRFMSLTSASDVCGLWSLPSCDGSRVYLVPKL